MLTFIIVVALEVSFAGVFFSLGSLYMLQKTRKHVDEIHKSATEGFEAGQRLVGELKKKNSQIAHFNLDLMKENKTLKRALKKYESKS